MNTAGIVALPTKVLSTLIAFVAASLAAMAGAGGLDRCPFFVTGNTPDSGESWFEPRRGNLKAVRHAGDARR